MGEINFQPDSPARAVAAPQAVAVPIDPTHLRPWRVIVGRYALFAVISMVLNLGAQELVERLAPDSASAAKLYLYLSILAGTVVGFSSRYILDKKWVFYDSYDGHFDELKKLILYAAFAGVTTLIFWAAELSAFFLVKTVTAKYAGATIGLTVGFTAKYFLDKNYVFRVGSATKASPASTIAAAALAQGSPRSP